MSFQDDYQLPEMIVTPEGVDPTKAITYDQESDINEAKKKLAAALAQRIAEEEDQSGVRSQLRDVFNSNSQVGFGSELPPPAPDTLRLTVTPGDLTNVSSGPAYGPPGDLTQDQAPNLEGTIPDLLGAFGSPDPQQIEAPPEGGMTTFLDQATRSPRQLVRGALSTVGALPWQLAAGAVAIPGVVSELTGLPRPPGTDTAINWLLGRAENNRRFAEDVTGLSGDAAAPTNPVEQVSKIVGESFTPLKGATLAATGIVAGVNSLFTPAEAKTKAERAAEAKLRESKTQTIIETIGGPAKVDKREIYTLGGIAAATIGMIFAPSIYRMFKTGSVPKLRPVEDAAPGTQAMSNNMDLARTYDDANAGVLRMARRAGVDPVIMKDMEKTFAIQTRANAHALVDSAILQGRMETPNFRFQSKMPVAELARRETPQSIEYLHLRNTFDELQHVKVQPGANPGPPTIRGMTDTDVLQQLGALERAHPELRAYGDLYRDNLKAMRKFAGEGEYATISKKQLRYLNAQRSNTTQFHGISDDPRANLGSPTENLATQMHRTIRERLENEAKGQYIDALRKVNPDLAVRITPQDLAKNYKWKPRVVEIYRRGNKELYTTDRFVADVLRMDPYYLGTMSGQQMYGLRRLLETTTTGRFAPWFAPISATRNLLISRFTVPAGRKAPTPWGTLYAIPQQLAPQMAHAISASLDRGSGQWLTKVFGQAGVNNMSLRLSKAYKDSLVAQLQAAGSTHASILENQTRAITRLQHASNAATGTGKAILKGYEATLQAIHNAPMHAFASRNRGRASNVDLAAEARHLTGSPKVSGAYYTGSYSGFGRPRPIDVEPGTRFVTHKLAKGWGRTNQVLTEMAPWHNVTVQGMKRIAEAYVANPALFTGRLWLYSMGPAASVYYAARGMGDDPNGRNYVDYMMNGRSNYQKQMYMYFPIPGRPVEEGLEIPNFHELAPAWRMMQVALDHATRSSIFSESDDFTKAAMSFFNTAIEPPMPPILNLPLASQGFVAPMGAFGGEAYKKKVDPYDQTGGLPASLDILARAMGGGMADVIGTGYAAFVQTPEGLGKASANALSASGKRIIEKTPYVRDIANIRAPITGNTPITEELFKKQKVIDNLVRFYQNYGTTGEYSVNLKPASQGGGAIADLLLGENTSSQPLGLNQPKPTNPLYLEFIQRVRDSVKKDNPETGGMGFKSMWRRYGDLSKHLTKMRNINDGNYVTWQKQIDQLSDAKIYLNEYGVDKTNPRAVRNFLEHQRQNVARKMLFMIRSVEEDMSKEKGRRIKLEDLDPYGKSGVTGANSGLLPDPLMEMQLGSDVGP